MKHPDSLLDEAISKPDSSERTEIAVEEVGEDEEGEIDLAIATFNGPHLHKVLSSRVFTELLDSEIALQVAQHATGDFPKSFTPFEAQDLDRSKEPSKLSAEDVTIKIITRGRPLISSSTCRSLIAERQNGYTKDPKLSDWYDLLNGPVTLQSFTVMERLPVELRQAVLEHLATTELKAIRLTSKAWATLGEEYLISPYFTALPHRNEIERLLSISAHPKYSYRILSITINLGEVNEYHARHNTYFLNYMRDSESRLQAQEEAWSTYNKLKLLKEEYLPQNCDQYLLTQAFRRLPNLRHITVSLTNCPFEESTCPELLSQIWGIPSTRLLPRVATTERFTSILTALSSSPIASLKTLSHDRLPFEFFAQKPLLISLLSTTFNALTSLSLTLDYSDMPNNLHSLQAFQNLSHCLRCATELKTLNLSFQGRKKITISPLLSSFSNHAFSFRYLESLKLEGVMSSGTELGNFIISQKALKRLQIGGEGLRARHQPPNGGVHLQGGSFKELFTRLKSEMRLERLDVMGDLVGLESGERWVLDNLVEEMNLREFVTD